MAFFALTFLETENELESAWLESACETPLVVEFGLAREFMFQLRIARSDPFVGLVGALSELSEEKLTSRFLLLFLPACLKFHSYPEKGRKIRRK